MSSPREMWSSAEKTSVSGGNRDEISADYSVAVLRRSRSFGRVKRRGLYSTRHSSALRFGGLARKIYFDVVVFVKDDGGGRS